MTSSKYYGSCDDPRFRNSYMSQEDRAVTGSSLETPLSYRPHEPDIIPKMAAVPRCYYARAKLGGRVGQSTEALLAHLELSRNPAIEYSSAKIPNRPDGRNNRPAHKVMLQNNA